MKQHGNRSTQHQLTNKQKFTKIPHTKQIIYITINYNYKTIQLKTVIDYHNRKFKFLKTKIRKIKHSIFMESKT